MTEKLTTWDIQDSRTMKTEKGRRAYLKYVAETYADEPETIARAIGDVARARGMADVAKATGLSRQGLYKALDGKGSPSFDTIWRVARELGISLRVG